MSDSNDQDQPDLFNTQAQEPKAEEKPAKKPRGKAEILQRSEMAKDFLANWVPAPEAEEKPAKKPRKKAEEKPAEPAAPEPATDAGPSPFNPANLRCPTVGYSTSVKKVRTNLKVRTPAKEWFVRTHSDPNYWMEVWGVEMKETREFYVALPALTAELRERGIGKLIHLALAVNRQGEPFFWPLRIHNPEDKRKPDSWLTSATEAAGMAKKDWVRVVANMPEQQYDIFKAMGDLPGPEFPQDSMESLLRLAFKGSLIDSLDHPVIREFEGRE